jgi:hypothetical protein
MPPGDRRYYPSRFKVFVYRTKRGKLVAAVSGDPPWRVGEINVGRGGGAEIGERDLPVTLVATTKESTAIKIARAQVAELNESGQKGLEIWAKKNIYVPRKEASKISS